MQIFLVLIRKRNKRKHFKLQKHAQEMCLAIGLWIHLLQFNELPLRAEPKPHSGALQGRHLHLKSQAGRGRIGQGRIRHHWSGLKIQFHFGSKNILVYLANLNFICKRFQPYTTGNPDFSETYQQEIPELEGLTVMNLLYIQALNVNLDYNVKNKHWENAAGLWGHLSGTLEWNWPDIDQHSLHLYFSLCKYNS